MSKPKETPASGHGLAFFPGQAAILTQEKAVYAGSERTDSPGYQDAAYRHYAKWQKRDREADYTPLDEL